MEIIIIQQHNKGVKCKSVSVPHCSQTSMSNSQLPTILAEEYTRCIRIRPVHQRHRYKCTVFKKATLSGRLSALKRYAGGLRFGSGQKRSLSGAGAKADADARGSR
jgi:hypothetical protein